MIIYTWILIALNALVFLMQLSGGEDSKALSTVLSFLVSLPLFGRVLGWF
jgi:hypothetical protein